MRTLITTIIISFFTLSSFAGCMTKQIKQIDAKIENSTISQEDKAEAMKLRDLIVENEHSDREAADKFYTAALELLN